MSAGERLARERAAQSVEDVRSMSPDRQVAWLLQRLDLARRGVEHRASLGTAELRLLWLFSDGNPRTLREIADELGLEQSTVNRQVNGALKAGLLEGCGEPGSTPRRMSATESGRQRFESDLAGILGAYGSALTGIDEARRPAFLEALGDFVDAYESVLARG